VPEASTMRPTAVLASALVRLETVLTATVGAGQVETVPETPVGAVGQEQTVAPLDST
jgi:hypothetical protein